MKDSLCWLLSPPYWQLVRKYNFTFTLKKAIEKRMRLRKKGRWKGSTKKVEGKGRRKGSTERVDGKFRRKGSTKGSKQCIFHEMRKKNELSSTSTVQYEKTNRFRTLKSHIFLIFLGILVKTVTQITDMFTAGLELYSQYVELFSGPQWNSCSCVTEKYLV